MSIRNVIRKIPPVNSAIVRFAVLMLFTLALPFSVILFLAANNLSRMEKEIANQFLSSNLRTVALTLDQVLTNLERLHAFTFMDTQFLGGMRGLALYEEREEYSDYLNTISIKNRINNVAATNNYIFSLYAYSLYARRFFSSRINWDPDFNFFLDSFWLRSYMEQGLDRPWHFTEGVEDGRTLLVSYREVWDNNQPIGLVSINVDAEEAAKMLYEVIPNVTGSTFIMDDWGNIVRRIAGPSDFGNDAAFIDWLVSEIPEENSGFFDTSYEGNEIFVSYYRSQYSGFRFVAAAPLKQIQTGTSVMFQLFMIFILLQVIMIVMIMILASYYFWTPLRILFTGMRQVQEGDFSARLPHNPAYEFGYINNNFNIMAENIQRLIEENYASKLISKEAQLKNLQNQLNEHFLYNTLDSIHWLARKENAQQASQMVFALANFYRISLSSGHEIIPVRDVVQMIQNYLYIQKSRMQDVSYSITCDPSLEDTLMPKGLLQPLVENALIHGLKSLNRPGEILVTFENISPCMKVTVADNGRGFTEERLRQVREQLESPDSFRDQSFALKTIQSQIWLYYNTKNSVNIETAPDKGAVIWFSVPVIEKESNK